jgi:hypothetical protein
MALVVLLAFNAWLWLQQSSMIFFPLRGIDATPADWNMEYEEVELRTADGVALHGWYIPAATSDRVLLFFHGNAGNISHRGESLAIFHRLGLNVLIIDYRGYGRSEGRPSEEGLHTDAVASWRFVRETKGFAADRVVLFGRSLGGAVAARLATEVKPAALILESSFSSARDVAAEHFPLLSKLIVLRYNFDTVGRVKGSNSPLLVIHSEDDEMIPFHLGERIYAAASEPKQLLRLRGGHNLGFTQSQPEYERGIGEFLSRHVPGKLADATAKE